MHRQRIALFATGLLCGTILTPALAQENDRAAGNQQSCERLTQLIQENEDRFRSEWINEANDVVRQGERQECAQYVAQAEQAVERLDAREARNQQTDTGEQRAEGQSGQQAQQTDPDRIVVEQPNPRVTVQQDSPEITYDQPEPRVNVRQGQPEVIVRQAEPTVRVEMPRPRITIDQPEPEIVVRMPEPDVAVSVPEPEIDVSQTQPEVRVRQPEPEVRIQDEGDARVQVERSQPIVQQQDQGQQQAQVNVERQRPQVRYEAARPNVQFEMTGEPQVTFNRTGEPQVRFETAEQQQTADQRQQRRGGEQDQQQQARAQADGAEETASVGQQGVSDRTYRMLRGDGGQEASGQTASVPVSEIVDRDLVNARGDELGTVERVIRSNDRLYVVLSHGGFLGLGEDEVALPLDRISALRGGDELVLRGMTEEDIEQLPEVDADADQELGSGQEVRISQSS
ncbi:PRC-barrel domain-containing protein [Nitratireductor thuwali]|uniref:PRC-barrel domain-containing protein n=1 Tax=Nitratireductor thuwali TaxID=2267699 RepID=A0ABY5MKK8_9HYPH|nr:hypothetical protein NTH_02817 [Nitratireductor thuwali]